LLLSDIEESAAYLQIDESETKVKHISTLSGSSVSQLLGVAIASHPELAQDLLEYQVVILDARMKRLAEL